MIQTTYYEFNKPEGTDLVNPLVDTNPNWDALDADLHEFNERSIANCTEVVALGVHTISRLDTTAKFLKWIATANYTAGETFTVDGLPVAATTPAGATLATNAYVTGSVVLACLNADNTAMTIFVSGTAVASDAERLGGELPSYYATQSDMTDAEADILNLQNQMGNTSIVGIGDGTATGAISAINADLTDLINPTYTALISINNSNINQDFNIDWNGYSKLLIVANCRYSATNDTYTVTKELTREELKMVGASPTPSSFVYPRITCYNYSDVTSRLQILLGVANSDATTFRFQVDNATYGWSSINVYGIT